MIKRVIEKKIADRIDRDLKSGKITLLKAIRLRHKHSYPKKDIIKAAS